MATKEPLAVGSKYDMPTARLGAELNQKQKYRGMRAVEPLEGP